MEDEQIISLYWRRNENAIKETQNKYHFFLMKIARAVLGNRLDCEETVNDTYLKVCNLIPNDCPEHFSAYIAKITRRLSIDVFRRKTAVKRGAGEYVLSLEELEDCETNADDPQTEAERNELKMKLNAFLRDADERDRDMFIQRYFYFYSIREIAREFSVSESNAKTILFRMRKELKDFLQREGY